MKSLSRPEIIQLAACPQCAAPRKRPCMFAPCEDPEGRRTYAGQSHDARTFLAKKIAAREENAIQELAKSLKL